MDKSKKVLALKKIKTKARHKVWIKNRCVWKSN